MILLKNCKYYIHNLNQSYVNTIEMEFMYQIIHPFKICNSIFQNYASLHHYCGICPSIHPSKKELCDLSYQTPILSFQ